MNINKTKLKRIFKDLVQPYKILFPANNLYKLFIFILLHFYIFYNNFEKL